ncbi:response regulator [Halorubrum rutilum]|uniref:Response regulator n=1 Tax=Halorubrum rutilum TaxID=1364933 RepID=A0ABD6AH82_9EURY|nr:response regulator [Halorubrum rutilum]
MTDHTTRTTSDDATTDTADSDADDADDATDDTAADRVTDADATALLHVEPDPRSAELFSVFVDRFADGIAVRSVDGTAAALDAVDEADCVVTEHRLPDGSGVELVDRIRGRGVEVPVVFHTTCREAETEAAALDAGADAYFAKRSERGQYGRVLERLRGLLGDGDPRTARAATGVPPDVSASSAGEE